ncbi:hypothetical protein [Curtobacterium sp. MCSS17_015]|uniref:hypothetical protein n=1 Tax=Curtobacterium sp. MCSS17_015 TaxID=2175666 RepID=UPI000DA7F95D|nr:hypothetical protein [Curtobacterium sp. MCSS17_015]WIB25808.1 hypothetical protein DEJ18_12220 [Curtobacterium sp. MCSS17_015]
MQGWLAMRDSGSQVADVLRSGSFDMQWVADVYYDGTRRLSNVPITEPKFVDDGSALVQSTGSCTVVWTPDFAESLSPQAADDTLAPFGSELSVAVIISAGTFTERIQMGWYRIDDVPNADDQFVEHAGHRIVVGSRVELTLQDRFRRVQKDRFDVPGSPPSRTSVLNEAQRISGLQIVREVPDATIPRGFAYEEERLDPLYDLLEFADAVPYMRPDGSMGQRPIDWGAPVDVVTDGNDGSLVSLKRAMSSSTVYNRIAVRSSATDGGAQILASAEITSGPLRARNSDGSPSPYGRVTYYYSSDLITNRAQAKQYATQNLPRVSSLRVTERPMTELFNPLRQVGDVLTIRSSLEPEFQGRVKTINRNDGATQDVTLEVS